MNWEPHLATCQDCGKPFHRMLFGRIGAIRCDDCAAVIVREMDAEGQRRRDRMREQWESQTDLRREIMTEEFFASLPSSLSFVTRTDQRDPRFRSDLNEKLANWRPTKSKPTLGIFGESGSCKTRCAILMALRLLQQRIALATMPSPDRDFMAPPSVELEDGWDAMTAIQQSNAWLEHGTTTAPIESRRIARTYCGSFAFRTARDLTASFLGSFDDKPKIDAEKRRLRTVKVLVIDDLGKIGKTAHQLSELFDLVDARLGAGLVTIWTANTAPEQFLEPGGPEYGEPLIRRLAGPDEATVFYTGRSKAKANAA